MKRVEAYIRIHKLEDVKLALEDAGIRGMTVEQVKGYGRQQGQTDKYRGSTYALNLIPKLRVDVVVEDEELERVLEIILETSHTGEIGDGKIFVSDVIDAIRIRTKERGSAALR
ncbi:MAG: P-II family nitrogen regulator [Armatimonadetes bacterium]|nr:P-II family nitrogen regulator [Armatimonadota bacterium]